MEVKKKLTDIFLRKEDKTKKQVIQQKVKIIQFDQSYFQAQLINDNYNTNLIKVMAVVKKGPNQGEQIPLNCKWYIKNKFDFKQIQQVKASCFQPCLQDVGNTICVQIEPCIEGMTYTGITIMKQSGQLKMDKKLQAMSNQYFISNHLQLEGKIQIIYSQNPQYQKFEYPLDVTIILRQNSISFRQKISKQTVCKYNIDQEFPQIDFIRKSFNSIIFTCNENQSMKLSLQNNFNRDLFSLIVRSIPSRLIIKKQEDKNFDSQKFQLENPIQNKKQINSQQTTKLILKIDQLHKDLKGLKRINEQLTTNYHLERNAKITLQNQIQKLKNSLQKTNQQHFQCKPLHTKIKHVLQQNKFYFGQLSLLKNQVKQKNHLIKDLKQEIKRIISEKESSQSKIQQLIEEPKNRIKRLEEELIKNKTNIQNLQNQNETLKQKVNQLQNSNNVLKKKISSISSEKSLPNSPVKSGSYISSLEDISPSKDRQIKELKMQILNLQMLLKHKSGQKGGQLIKMHQLVNSLTQRIGEKQIEIESLKRINKELSKNEQKR